MERQFPPYVSITACLVQTTLLGGLAYRTVIAPRKQFLGVWVAVGLVGATYLSAETTLEVIRSRMSLPAVQTSGKPS